MGMQPDTFQVGKTYWYFYHPNCDAVRIRITYLFYDKDGNLQIDAQDEEGNTIYAATKWIFTNNAEGEQAAKRKAMVRAKKKIEYYTAKLEKNRI